VSDLDAYFREIMNALDHVPGGGDLSTDELVDIRDEARAALDEIEAEVDWLRDKLGNIQDELRRL
jgi:hypothetical protein